MKQLRIQENVIYYESLSYFWWTDLRAHTRPGNLMESSLSWKNPETFAE